MKKLSQYKNYIFEQTYLTYPNKIIISNNFNSKLTNNLINIIFQYKCLIFSDYPAKYNMIYLVSDYIENLNLSNRKNFYSLKSNTKSKFNQDISGLSLNFGLEEINFGYNFNHPVDNNLPKGLIKLTLGYNFNHPVDNLPKGLIKLTLGYNFNHPIDNLPQELIYFTISYGCFNHPVNNLPQKITHLNLGSSFDHSVDYLPNGLIYLKLGKFFNQPIDNLPYGLSHLELGESFNHSLDNLPITTKQIIFYENLFYYHKIFNSDKDPDPYDQYPDPFDQHFPIYYNFAKFGNNHLTVEFNTNKKILYCEELTKQHFFSYILTNLFG